MVISSDPIFDDDDVQGDVLPGFRSSSHEAFTQCFLFFEISGPAARQPLDEFRNRVTSGRSLRKERGEPPPDGPSVNIGFTWSGLHAIGLEGSWSAEFEDFDAFKLGLKRHTIDAPDLLGSPDGWVDWAREKEIGAIVNVGGADATAVGQKVAEARDVLDHGGFTFIEQQTGSMLPGRKEPFGFADGLSQPLVEGYHDPKDPTKGYPSAREVAAGTSASEHRWRRVRGGDKAATARSLEGRLRAA